MQTINNLSVIIGTCDSYLKYMPNCIHLMNKYFKPDCKKIIVGETSKIDFLDYYWHLYGKIQWGDRMKRAVSTIDTEYVFFMLDDY